MKSKLRSIKQVLGYITCSVLFIFNHRLEMTFQNSLMFHNLNWLWFWPKCFYGKTKFGRVTVHRNIVFSDVAKNIIFATCHPPPTLSLSHTHTYNTHTHTHTNNFNLATRSRQVLRHLNNNKNSNIMHRWENNQHNFDHLVLILECDKMLNMSRDVTLVTYFGFQFSDVTL